MERYHVTKVLWNCLFAFARHVGTLVTVFILMKEWNVGRIEMLHTISLRLEDEANASMDLKFICKLFRPVCNLSRLRL
jgi:hypothetical protein